MWRLPEAASVACATPPEPSLICWWPAIPQCSSRSSRVVAAELDGEDMNRAAKAYEGEAESLRAEVDVLNAKLEEAVNQNTLLSSKSKKQHKELHRLSEALEGEREKVEAPFKSSESAIMITNESHGDKSLPTEAEENFFLNEDVIKLSQLQYKEN